LQEENFDLIVIGSGSGLDVANAAASQNLKVAIIEKNMMGGTCLNRGCIPSKLLIHSANVAETIRRFTEQQLKTQDKNDYVKSIYPYIQTAMGKAIEDRNGFVKFLVNRKDKKILGCHIIGTDASTLIHEVLVAMKGSDGTINSIKKTIHIHPALSEVIAKAAERIS
jgi:pyruvate/2-oxoglutarate dehydrogenase complex dihydrolipoamide dehydrogenase (E3) component